MSPDGAWIAFYSERGGEGYRIWRVPFDGGAAEQLTTEDGRSPRYSADGNFIYFSSNRGGGFGLYRMPANGGAATLIQEIPSNASLSPDGLWFVYSDGDYPPSIWKRQSDLAAPAVQLTTAIDGDYSPAWSPDGNKVVFYRGDPDDTDNHLYIMNSDGSDLHALTNTANQGEDSDPAWVGEWIAFERGGQGTEERVFKVKATGETEANPAIQLTFNPVSNDSDNNPCWTVDGNWIAFDSRRNDNYDIYVISSEGEPQEKNKLISRGITAP